MTDQSPKAEDVVAARAKRPKGTSREVWGILNPYGDIWTTDTFETPEAAKAYIEKFWRDFPGSGTDTRRFRPVKVRVRVTAITPLTFAPPALLSGKASA